MTEQLKTTKGLHDKNFWKLKKKILNPRDSTAYPVLDKNNEICYAPDEQKQAYEDHYKEVLQTRPTKPEYEAHAAHINGLFTGMYKKMRKYGA